MSFTDKFDSLEERFNALARAASETSSWDAEEVRRESDRYARSRSQQGERRSSTQSERRTAHGVPSGERRRKERGNPLGRFALWLVCVVVVSFLLAEVGWLLMNDLCAFNKPELTVTLTVEKDDSVSTVAKKLKDAGLIDYKWFFKLYAAVSSAEDKIGEGEHKLTSDMDYHALINNMKSASGGSLTAETVKVTIPEGYTVAQTIALLAEKEVNTVEALTEAAESYAFDYTFLSGTESGDISRLEGFLFPDTYEFYVGEKASSALGRLLSNFERKMNEELLAAVDESGYSLRQIITIASLIEEETDGTDQKRISSVIYNRINNPSAETVGLLQIDAALIYGLGYGAGAQLSDADKEIDTPYNLYLRKGLPPTPISNPGMDAIKAALNPEDTNYFYYALGKDGLHHYFETYRGHSAFVSSSEYGG